MSKRKCHCFESLEYGIKLVDKTNKQKQFNFYKTFVKKKQKQYKPTTMTDVKEMIGWELLYTLIARDVKTESDIIVAITHWYLIKEAGFRCLGTGDEVNL